MRVIILSLLLMAGLRPAAAQQPAESVWSFGRAAVLDFSSLSPVVSNLPNNGGGPIYAFYQWSATVCDNSGSVLFWAKLINTTNPVFNVFDRNGHSMPNGYLLSTNLGNCVPIVVPMPGSNTKFYLFYTQDHGLMYSVIDMTLNNGLGDVVRSQKNILLGSYGAVLDRKMAAVQGCNGVWIIVRSASQNQYMSYGITRAGIAPVPNLSNAGNFPLSYYGSANTLSGVLKASPDGKRMAAACGNGNVYVPGSINGGLELYDIEPCSGRLLNPAVIDTGMFYGACFSPDGTKLYATKSFERKVYQYDVSLPSPAMITASRTLILSNPSPANAYPDENLLGELKRARDGKIYVGNYICHDQPFAAAMHAITKPNNAGSASNPVINAVTIGNSCPGLDLPADIVYEGIQDTVYARKHAAICFRDSGFIQAPAGHCYRWAGDTTTSRTRFIKKPGDYIVRYSDDDCHFHIDTIGVTFTKLNVVTGSTFSCPGRPSGAAWVAAGAGEAAKYTYAWMNSSGAVVRRQAGAAGDTLKGADTGTYRVRLTSAAGCDTTLYITVNALPAPVAGVLGDTVVCKHVPVRFSSNSLAPAWRWYFDGKAGSADSAVVQVYNLPGNYEIMLVARNIEGCTDTARVRLEVRELVMKLAASEESVNIGREVTLNSSALQGYSVLAWQPAAAFNGGLGYSQQVAVSRTSTYLVVGQSTDGCIDSASVTVHVNPILFMPNAFTPNGDGLNDRFKPQSAGDEVFIRHFEIFNRWGQLVWLGFGRNAVDGWDGTFGGRPADLGTYFYTITVETPSGGSITQKGDVILIR